MKKIIVGAIVFLSIGYFSFIAKKEKMIFPKVQTVSLEGKQVMLPEDLKGKYTLLCVALDQKGIKDLSTWVKPIYTDLLHTKRDNSVVQKDEFNINTHFVILGEAMSQELTKQLVDSLEAKHALDLTDKFLFASGLKQELSDALKLKNSSTANGFLLDYKGTIVYRFEGSYSEGKLNKLESILSDTK
jgi:hypothetical protein